MSAIPKCSCLAMLGASSLVAYVPPALAQEMVRAYALIETSQGTSLPEALGGLMNCKGLTTSWVSSEVVAHIQCNDLNSLNVAMGDILEIDGVLQITLWSVERIE